MFLRFDRNGKKSIRINLQAKTKMSKYYLLFMNTVANVEHAKNIKLIYSPFLRGIFLIIFSLSLSRSSSSSFFLFIFQHEIFIIIFLCGGVCVCILLGLREFLSLLMYSLITTFRALCAHLFIPNGLIVWDINISYASRYLCASVCLSQCSVCITLVLFIYNSTTFMVNDLWKIGKKSPWIVGNWIAVHQWWDVVKREKKHGHQMNTERFEGKSWFMKWGSNSQPPCSRRFNRICCMCDYIFLISSKALRKIWKIIGGKWSPPLYHEWKNWVKCKQINEGNNWNHNL